MPNFFLSLIVRKLENRTIFHNILYDLRVNYFCLHAESDQKGYITQVVDHPRHPFGNVIDRFNRLVLRSDQGAVLVQVRGGGRVQVPETVEDDVPEHAHEELADDDSITNQRAVPSRSKGFI